MTARKPHRFPKVPSPNINTVTMSVKASTCGFRGGRYLNHSKKQVQNEKQAQLNLGLSVHLQDLSILIRNNSIVYCFDFLFFFSPVFFLSCFIPSLLPYFLLVAGINNLQLMD